MKHSVKNNYFSEKFTDDVVDAHIEAMLRPDVQILMNIFLKIYYAIDIKNENCLQQSDDFKNNPTNN